jgi:hypothetical protein
MTVIEHGKKSKLSIARFTQESGAASSFNKVVETMEMVLKSRGFLLADERKKRMMIKTLNTAWALAATKVCVSVMTFLAAYVFAFDDQHFFQALADFCVSALSLLWLPHSEIE